MLLFSHSVMSNSLWPHGLQQALFPGLHHLPELAQTQVHQVSDAIQPSHSLFSHSPPTFSLSQHQGLCKWIRRPKYWSFSFNISPFNEHPGLISFRMDWLDLLAVQGSLLQHHSSKASVLQGSATFMVHGPTFTSIHDYWKNHSFDETDLCWQSNVSAF